MTKTGTERKPSPGLMIEILALQRAIYRRAEAKGLARYLVNSGRLEVMPHDGDQWWADIELRFRPNHGIEYTLTHPVTAQGEAWPISQTARADLFVEYLEHLRDRAEEASATRKAIRRATLEVIAEAEQEGIALELMRMEASPIIVCGSPERANRRGRYRQVYDVHLLMPHDDAGTLTEDAWTIDADEPGEFADYLRTRLLPELRELLARFRKPAAG